MTPVVRDVVGISKNGWNTVGCSGSLEQTSTAQKAFRGWVSVFACGAHTYLTILNYIACNYLHLEISIVDTKV